MPKLSPIAVAVRPSRLAALIVGALLAMLSPRLYAQVRLAVVDMQRALVETEQGRIAKNQLKGLFQKRQVELDGRQQALKRLRDDIEHQRNALDQEALRHRMEDYQKQFVDLQQNYLQYQQELAQREAELTKAIYANLESVIRQIGQQQQLTAVFEQSGVIWAPEHLDLTDQVVQAFNQQYPPSAGSSAPAHPAPAADAGTAPSAPATPTPGPATTTTPRHPVANPHPRGEQSPPAQ